MEQNKKQKTGKILICPVCKKKMYKKKSEIEKCSNIDNLTCSMSCNKVKRHEIMSGIGNHQYGKTRETNSSFKGEDRNKNTKNHYVLIYKPSHPYCDGSGYVPRYILVAEEFLLNELNSVVIDGENHINRECVVHHIDFNKKNDNKENLYIFSSSSKHIIFHNMLGTRVNSIEEFEDYYNNFYEEKLFNYNWMYTVYVTYGLSCLEISNKFNLPYKTVVSQVKIFNLNNERFELLNERVLDLLGSSGK